MQHLLKAFQPRSRSQDRAAPAPDHAGVGVTDAARSLSWAALFGVAVVVGRLTALPETGLALFWPAAGVAALWLLQAPAGRLGVDVALLATATVVSNQASGVALLPAVAFGAANVAVGVAARWVWARRDPPAGLPLLSGARDVVTLAGAAAAAALASAPFGAAAGLLITGAWTPLGSAGWVVRNATGVFVVAGTVLAVVAARRGRAPGLPWWCCLTHQRAVRVVPELTATLLASFVALGLVFEPGMVLPLAFVPLAFSSFVGFRYAPVVAAVHTAVSGVVAVVATLAGWGPFGSVADPATSAMIVQSFVLAQAAIALTLSWAVAERHALTVELERARQDADDRAQLLGEVTERMAHGVAVIDADGRVLVRNSVAAHLVPGPGEVITEDDQPERYGVRRADGAPMDLASMPHSQVLEQGVPVETDLVVTRDGDESFVSVRADPLALHGGDGRRVAVVSLQDVTAHHRQVQQLQSFAGVVAHDLRNPLSALTGWVQVLADHLEDHDALDVATTNVLRRIEQSGQRMSELIEDLLSYATASSAALALGEVHLDPLLAAVTAEVGAASGRDPRFDVGPLGSVLGDGGLLRQLFTNVVGNAVKYTADGVRPEVAVTAVGTSRAIVISVCDNGIGIPEEMRERVLQPFARLPEAARTRSGTGLGLAICARAAERHGGSLEVAPGPDGRGTTVVVSLPRGGPPDGGVGVRLGAA